MRMMYTAFFYCCLPLMVLRLLWRSIKAPDYRRRWSERFGYCFGDFFVPQPSQTVSSQRPLLWLHTVSVGETLSAKPLVLALLEQYPEHQLLITTMTPTASVQVRKIFASGMSDGRIVHSYIPYDLPDCIARFLQRAKPQLAIFMETEAWPNILAACHQRGIPSVLVNARLSARSLAGYQRFQWLTGPIYPLFSYVAAQTDADAERIRILGATNIAVTGSLKLEITVSEALRKKATQLRDQWSDGQQRKIIIAASTHSGEDEVILAAFQRVLEQQPNTLLVLVPRHPERFDDVYRQCCDTGLQTVRRSENTTPSESSGAVLPASVQLMLGDTMGELMLLYGIADIAIVGGSFITRGGHNMLEPAVWGLPIISGQSVFNFATIAKDMVNQEALLLCDEDNLLEHVLLLLHDPEKAQHHGQKAKAYVDNNRGALSNTVSILQQQTVA